MMSNDAASFIGSIPQHYDQGLGPIIFVDYAADMRGVSPPATQRGCWKRRRVPASSHASCVTPYPKTRG
jgi:hypothetical protein